MLRVLGPAQARDWVDVDLTMSQLKMMFVLSSAMGPVDGTRGLRVGEVARGLGVTLPTVTAVMDKLVERGLVRRDEDPLDRRQHVCRLTADGQALLHRLMAGPPRVHPRPAGAPGRGRVLRRSCAGCRCCWRRPSGSAPTPRPTPTEQDPAGASRGTTGRATAARRRETPSPPTLSQRERELPGGEAGRHPIVERVVRRQRQLRRACPGSPSGRAPSAPQARAGPRHRRSAPAGRSGSPPGSRRSAGSCSRPAAGRSGRGCGTGRAPASSGARPPAAAARPPPRSGPAARSWPRPPSRRPRGTPGPRRARRTSSIWLRSNCWLTAAQNSRMLPSSKVTIPSAVSSIGTPPSARARGTGCTNVPILPITWTGRLPRIQSA